MAFLPHASHSEHVDCGLSVGPAAMAPESALPGARASDCQGSDSSAAFTALQSVCHRLELVAAQIGVGELVQSHAECGQSLTERLESACERLERLTHGRASSVPQRHSGIYVCHSAADDRAIPYTQ